MADLTHEQAKALAGRWMSTEGFVYEPGMLAWREGRHGIIAEVRDDALWLHGEGLYGLFDPDECWPDLRHAGTRGFALEQMRGVWGDRGAGIGVSADDFGWNAFADSRFYSLERDTEAEAIIAAIEAAER